MTTQYPCPPFGLTRLPHSTSCEKYIQCFAGEAVERECGPDLHYNAEKENCMEPNLASCYRPQCPLYNDPANLVYIADYLECDKYYLCYNNEPYQYRCAEGLHWDEDNEVCTSPAEAECTDYEITCRPGETHNLPNPRFCNQFYFCLQGESFPTACPADLLFDIRINQCNYAGDATCFEGSIRP